MTELLTIFGAGFVSVFALGFQSRNVNHGNYVWAAMTSMFVGVSQAYLWSHIIKEMERGGTAAAIVYALSGALAITSSMYVHERFIRSDRDKTKEKRVTGVVHAEDDVPSLRRKILRRLRNRSTG